MSDQDVVATPDRRGRRGLLVRLARGLGWALVATGVLIVLYLVYLLFFTNLRTEAAQRELLDQWELEYGGVDAALPGEAPGVPDEGPVAPAGPGDAYAALWFERDGQRIVHDDTLFVVEGVGVGDLRRGPGHYPETQAPGAVGNFAVAGHRTTYGAPFWALEELRPGDEIHVVDRDRHEWVYVVRSQEIVQPSDAWVLGADPLGEGGAWLTLTTCNPRFSAAQRLIVFAGLRSGPA